MLKLLEDNGYRAKMLCDSISPDGIRLSTIEVTFPRIVLAEYNTHRMFSRNSASSRAIPVEKQLKKINENPFIPIYWGKNQKGMQALEELSISEQESACQEWLAARDDMMRHAQVLLELGVHKQITNRLLEPFMWHTVICSATEWDNFFALRRHPDAQPEIKKAADVMWQALEASKPNAINYNDWHLPLVESQEAFDLQVVGLDVKLVSIGRCARVSYLTHDGKRDPQADIDLAIRLRSSGHMCYDDQTEVLTSSGWKYWPNVNDSDSLFTVDLFSNKGTFEIPIKLHAFDINEEVYSISGQQIDLKVTKNHNMVTSYRRNDGNWSEFGLESVSDLQGRPRRYLKSAQIDEKNIVHLSPIIIPPQLEIDYYRLLGFFIGDGHCTFDSDRVEFHLKKKRKIDFLKSLKFPINELKNDKYIVDFSGLGKLFNNICYTPNRIKKMPDEIFRIKPEKVKALFEGLRNSDGSSKRNTWVYYSTSKLVIDSLQALLHIHNKVGSVSKNTIKSGTYFKINVSDRIMPRIEINQNNRSNTYEEKSELYSGKVYCATMSKGTLMVRRNDKVVISGNSPYEHVARPMNKDEMYWFDFKGNDSVADKDHIPYLGNLKGWVQYRKELPFENDFSRLVKYHGNNDSL